MSAKLHPSAAGNLRPSTPNPRRAGTTVLAFDFGTKRIGVAVGDLALAIAHPLTTIRAEDSASRFAAIAALLLIRQLAPDRVLLPADVLFLFPPYAEAAAELGVVYPENPLVADTILPLGYRESADEPIPAPKVAAQLRYTTRALTRLVADLGRQPDVGSRLDSSARPPVAGARHGGGS